jgi:hypothetical protein
MSNKKKLQGFQEEKQNLPPCTWNPLMLKPRTSKRQRQRRQRHEKSSLGGQPKPQSREDWHVASRGNKFEVKEKID